MSFPKYPAYKESGVEWIREVPLGWKLERLKCSVLECKNGVWGQDPQFDEDDITCVRVADFDREKLNVSPLSLTVRNIKQKDTIGREVEFGDLLIEKSGGGEKQPVGCVVFYSLNYKSVCSNFIARIKTSNLFLNKYLLYVHKFLYDSGVTVRSIKQTSGIQNLDQNSYLNEKIPVPSLPEQQAIASFLDRECGKIDGLIAEQERLIALLAEKRQAVISHAVTKGLNPNAPMKDSGIPWIGMVPEGWEITKIKRICSLVTGITPPSNDVENYSEDGFPWINPADLQEIERPSFAHKYLSQKGKEYIRTLPEESILVCCIGTIGKFGYIDSPASTNQQITSLIPDCMMCPQFLLYLVATLKAAMENVATGNVLKILNSERLGNIDVSIPSFDTQREISFFIQKECQEISSLEKEVEASITLLKERRAALISAAVTGKIDVRAQSKALAA